MGELEYFKKFTINSTMEGLKECLDVAYEIQKNFNFEPSKEFAFQTVLVESVRNSICHGNKFNKDLLTIITIEIYNKQIKIEVDDQGDGFDLEKVPSPIEQHNINLENGRGIFFIKSLSESLNTRGKGNIVDIILNR